MKVLSALIDGTMYNSINEENTPFLSSFNKYKLKTIMGFSSACHATIHSGVYPEKHKRWFHWKFSPDTSPFKLTKYLPQWLCKVMPFQIRYRLFRKLCSKNDNHSVFGYPYLHNINPHYWSYFDVTEDKLDYEPNYLEGCKTIFEILSELKIKWKYFGLTTDINREQATTQLIREQINECESIKDLQYIFMLFGEIDYLSHQYTQNSTPVKEKLKEIDNLIKEIYQEINDDRCKILIFSDHGHVTIKEKIDIYPLLSFDLTEIPHLIDDMYIRVWKVQNPKWEEIVDEISSVPHLRILTEDRLKKEHLFFDSNLYGDLVAILEPHYIFARTSWRRTRAISAHGYEPDYEDCYGFMVSSEPLSDKKYYELIDILPLQLKLLGIDYCKQT